MNSHQPSSIARSPVYRCVILAAGASTRLRPLIGNKVALHESYGESIGVEIFSVDTVVQFYEILEHRIRTGTGRKEYYEESFLEIMNRGNRFSTVDVSNFPTIEIETAEDLCLADQLHIG